MSHVSTKSPMKGGCLQRCLQNHLSFQILKMKGSNIPDLLHFAENDLRFYANVLLLQVLSAFLYVVLAGVCYHY